MQDNLSMQALKTAKPSETAYKELLRENERRVSHVCQTPLPFNLDRVEREIKEAAKTLGMLPFEAFLLKEVISHMQPTQAKRELARPKNLRPAAVCARAEDKNLQRCVHKQHHNTGCVMQPDARIPSTNLQQQRLATNLRSTPAAARFKPTNTTCQESLGSPGPGAEQLCRFSQPQICMVQLRHGSLSIPSGKKILHFVNLWNVVRAPCRTVARPLWPHQALASMLSSTANAEVRASRVPFL